MPSDANRRTAAIAHAAFVVVCVAVAAFLVWRLSSILLLFFAAIVAATVLRGVGDVVARLTRLPHKYTLIASGALIVLIVAGFSYVLGAQISGQISAFVKTAPALISQLGDRLGVHDLAGALSAQAVRFAERTGIAGFAGYTSTVLEGLGEALLVLFAGVYLAAHPTRYRDGVLSLFPESLRERMRAAGENAGRALRLWLLGQAISMILIGVMAGAGLLLIGMHSALALGFIAGLAEFIPILGPYIGAAPAVLFAASSGWTTMASVIALFVVIQQVEGALVVPLIQRRTVDLPAALSLFALLGLGALFGLPGLLLAGPMTVVGYVGVKRFYLRDTLHEETSVPGEEPPRDDKQDQ